MASKKLGNLIKEARTNAGLTQEKLAAKIAGLTAADISKAERGEGDLTQDQLKKIAKATGVTQSSLLDAAKGTKTATAKKTATTSKTKSTSASSKSKSTSAAKTSSAASSMKVSAAEKKLVEAFRDATADQKKAALYILKGESNDLVDDILRKHSDDNGIGDILQDVLGGLFGK